MVKQTDFPSKWACESDAKAAKLELRVPNEEGLEALQDLGATGIPLPPSQYDWIEVPVVSAESFVEKGDAARIQRTSKVKIPTRWGRNTDDVTHNSPRQLINRFNDQNPGQFMFARLWLKRGDGEYVLAHLGWVGGVGPASQDGVTKFWMYDVAEMLSGATASVTFNSPTVEGAAEHIGKLVNANTPIPLSDVVVFPPESEEEFSRVLGQIGDEIFEEGPLGGQPITTYLGLQDIRPQRAREASENFTALTIDTGLNIPISGLDTKSFASNHDTLQDVVDWYEKKTSAKIHFEPAPDGESFVMMVDIVPERRTWAQEEVVSVKLDQGETLYELHDTVRVIGNNALYEMKPANTLFLRGDTSRSFLAPGQGSPPGQRYEINTDGTPALKYPSVKVQVPSLVEAAEGFELAPETIESNAETLEDAEREAVAELRKILEEESEGKVVLHGHPQVMPYDRLDAFEACQEDIIFERDPVRYEIEQVKHTTSGGEIYKTELTVSIWANDANIEVAESKMRRA